LQWPRKEKRHSAVQKEVRHELLMLPYFGVFDNIAFQTQGSTVSLYGDVIYGFPSLERYALGVQKPIRIIVNNGHVTLTGVVDTEADKNVAGMQANSVSGIFSVTNNLNVASQ
jgi:hyperosmotically inducible protein